MDLVPEQGKRLPEFVALKFLALSHAVAFALSPLSPPSASEGVVLVRELMLNPRFDYHVQSIVSTGICQRQANP